MASEIDEGKLSGMIREWDELAQSVGGHSDAALRGSGATTFLKGGQVELYERALESEVEFVTSTLAVKSSQRVLEIGCGNCVFLSRLAASAGLAVGIDLSHSMLRHGRRRLEREGRETSAHLVQVAMQSLPFKPHTFDKILLYACLQYVPSSELDRLLGSLAEVKTPDGLLLLGSLPTRTCLAHRRDAFIQLLRNAKRSLLGRPLVAYWRFPVDRLRRQLEQAGLVVVAEGTTAYNFYPLPTTVATRLRRHYERRRTFSRPFSSRYYFLCR